MKKCNDCKKNKEEIDFNKNQKICRGCQSVRYKNTYAKNQKAYNQRNVIRRQKFINILEKIKDELSCNHCIESDNVSLDFHHINPNNKLFEITDFVYTYSPNEKNIHKLKTEMAKCMVLCSNCHRKEHKRLKNLKNM